MTEQETELTEKEREELRGLFTLGLMAVLITLRVTQREITFSFLGQLYNITGIVDVTMMFWGLYVLLMLVWLSSDWFPRKVCQVSYVFGTGMMLFSFVLFYFTLIAIFSVVPMPWHLITYLLLIPLWYLAYRAIVQMAKAFRSAINAVTGYVRKQ